MKKLRAIVGLGVWIGLAYGIWQMAERSTPLHQPARRWASDVWEYSRGPRRSIDLNLPAMRQVGVGDPIFAANPQGELRQVGEIVALGSVETPLTSREAPVTQAQAMLYPGAPAVGSHVEMTYVSSPDSIAWVIQTLLPPERKAQIARELTAAVEAHRDEIIAALRPVVESSLRDSLQVVQQDLPPAIARRRGELQALGAKYHHDIVERELLPLVKREIWPIVRRHGEPVADEVGREVWQRVSLWRFGWRFMYDKSPLPEKRLVNKEWKRFVDEEALPVLEAHSADFLKVVQNTLRDTSRNPRVRASLRRSMNQVVDDPELQQVVWQVFEEVVVDNPRLHEAMRRNWTSPQAQAAFRLAADRMEPTVRRIGDLLFGTPERGISPEFAQVLRNQILHKDRRWFLLEDEASHRLTRPSREHHTISVRLGLPKPELGLVAVHEPG